MTTMKRKRDKQKRDPGGNPPAGVTLHSGWLFRRVALPEYRHDVIRMEPDSPPDRLDDDGLKRCRDRGLLLLHREIRLVPFLRQIRHRMLAPCCRPS